MNDLFTQLHNGRRRPSADRRGLSVLEFVGCAIAVVGGIWLGALYLGVDVRHIAHTALSETELLDNVPPDWRPPGPQEGVTRDQLVATLREELGTLRNEISTLRGDNATPDSDHSDAAQAAETTSAAEATKERTLAYWTRLNEIALGEAALQLDAELAFDEVNAAKVFAIKGRICRFAAKAVDTIPAEQVDATMVQFGRDARQWYEKGGELYERAVQIWESATHSQSRAQLNDEWRLAELHHKNETRLLRDKAAGVRSAVSRRFGVDFPPFAQAAE